MASRAPPEMNRKASRGKFRPYLCSILLLLLLLLLLLPPLLLLCYCRCCCYYRRCRLEQP